MSFLPFAGHPVRSPDLNPLSSEKGVAHSSSKLETRPPRYTILTESIADVQPARRELVFLPLSGHHGRVRAMAKAGWQTVFVQESMGTAAGEIRLRRKPVTDQRCCVVPEGEVKVFWQVLQPGSNDVLAAEYRSPRSPMRPIS